ncbi:hypothetical protein C8D87_103631 [Lentzea atacamensis]|uniref:Uncharacterized protein n=1 Tax=Lentzea atacamensis TaxID=531938 RepID=A0ABX9EEX1_9PSEU|nr:hypothetical protein C8D87_103631 [Lentzea atacamensis]
MYVPVPTRRANAFCAWSTSRVTWSGGRVPTEPKGSMDVGAPRCG